ncbi:2Fe-2S iron-sulfur cluster-binding protein [Ekhidna sp.]
MEAKFHSLVVSRVLKETFESHSITFKIPPALKDKFDFKPGQFVVIKLMIEGMEYNRPYSMSSAPYEDNLTITVKRLRGGIVSNYLIDHAKVGLSLLVKEPEGDFYYKTSTESRNHFVISAGSGITPMLSIIKAILLDEPLSKVHLLYGNRSEETIIFESDFLNLEKLHKDQFFVDFILSAPKKHRKPGLMGFLSKSEIKWKGMKGHIKHDTLSDFTSRYPVNPNSVVYICGPSGMIEGAEDFFRKKGVQEKNIISESFYVENHDLPGGKIKECQVKVHYKKEVYEVVIDDERSILDNLLKTDVVIPFACKSGLCSSCITKVIDGDVHSRVTKGLTASQRKDKHVLSCQSIPTTDTLEISYDIK